MNRLTSFIITFFLLTSLAGLIWGCQTSPNQQATVVTNLRCEYLTNPLGIDVASPRLSWIIESNRRGERQTAFQVLVASSEELLKKEKGDLWDSRKVASDQSIQLEYAGKPLESQQLCYWKVRIWDQDGKASPWSVDAHWSVGLLAPDDWQAKWITHPDPTRLSHPWLRRTFELKEGAERAVIYVNTGSYYELHINGKKVGPYVLEPGITQLNKRFIVNACDVTSFLVKGTNTIAVWMGPGWHQPINGNNFNAPILRAQLNIVTPSGPILIGTDASWRVKESCISQIGGWNWNNFGGERFDAREFAEDWDQIGLDDSQWAEAREIPAPQVVHSWQACEPARLSDPVKSVDWVRCSYQSPYGKILSNWKREGDRLTMEVTIPANTTATVYVPAGDAALVTESGTPAMNAKDVKFLRIENNAAVFEVGSGAYRFYSTLSETAR